MDTNDKDNLVFHYDRKERLKNAPDIVKKYYAGELQQPPHGLFKALFHTKTSRFMLIALAFTLVLTTGIILLGPGEDQTTLSGIEVSLSAFSFDDTIYVSIQTEGNDIAQEGEIIDLRLSFLNKEKKEVSVQEISPVYSKINKFIRTTSIDYDILYIECNVTIKAQTKTITCIVEQK